MALDIPQGGLLKTQNIEQEQIGYGKGTEKQTTIAKTITPADTIFNTIHTVTAGKTFYLRKIYMKNSHATTTPLLEIGIDGTAFFAWEIGDTADVDGGKVIITYDVPITLSGGETLQVKTATANIIAFSIVGWEE